MNFDEKIAALIQRIPKLVDELKTEEATKNALVLPFIAALGYDIFNPREVIPEFVSDIGIKKGEKVDYAIMRDNEIIMLIECKDARSDLSEANMSQLYRYFGVTKARIAILTNGIHYWFYSDLESPNIMDKKPFLELNLSNPKSIAMAEVKKMAKDDFDLDRMLSSASELKYISELKKVLTNLSENPDDEFVKFCFHAISPNSRFTGAVKEEFKPLVLKAFNQLISEKVNDRLRSALETEKQTSQNNEEIKAESETEPEDNGIVTTDEEIEGFYIIRAILSQYIQPERVVFRDTKSYMGILLDDNNRKPLCRLRFNYKQKYIGVFNENREEEKIPIEKLVDIYSYSRQIVSGLSLYEETTAPEIVA